MKTDEQVEGRWVDKGRSIFIAKRVASSLRRKISSPRPAPVDGRTLRKLRRFRRELREGVKSGGRELTPFDVIVMVDFLMKYGDSPDEIRKLRKPVSLSYDERQILKLIEEMNAFFEFNSFAYELAGIRAETLRKAGLEQLAA